MKKFKQKLSYQKERKQDPPRFDRNASRGKFSRKESFSNNFKKRRETKMHLITCDKCGKKSEVPFLPTDKKPVYCSECFGKGSSSNDKLEEINRKLNKIMRALGL